MGGMMNVKEREESMMTPEFWLWQMGKWGHSLIKRENIQVRKGKMGSEEMKNNSLGQMEMLSRQWYLEFKGEVRARNNAKDF